MKIFTIQSKMVDGKPVTSSATINFNVDEINLIRTVLHSLTPRKDEIAESIRVSIVEQLNTL